MSKGRPLEIDGDVVRKDILSMLVVEGSRSNEQINGGQPLPRSCTSVSAGRNFEHPSRRHGQRCRIRCFGLQRSTTNALISFGGRGGISDVIAAQSNRLTGFSGTLWRGWRHFKCPTAFK